MQTGSFWQNHRVCVTGGRDFLGSFVVERLRQRGAQNIFVPCKREYDLVESGDVKRMFLEAHPEIVIHLAAHVGGISANREHPAEFFYDNLKKGFGGRLIGTVSSRVCCI